MPQKQKPPVSKAKARKILRDGEINGKPLTPKQEGFFGAIVGGTPLMRVAKKT